MGKKKKHSEAAIITEVYDKLDKFVQDPKLPELPRFGVLFNAATDYLGSERFLGTGLWLWKEMRKMDR